MGWRNPAVLAALAGGLALLVLFVVLESRVKEPMLHMGLFRIRAFAWGNLAGLLASMARGGQQFILIIWLQGIWLPLRGYPFESTPLWAGVFLLPLTIGFLVAGPASGWLSDRLGSRRFAVAGALVTSASFIGLTLLPVDFAYPAFAALTFLSGVGSGMFSAPNTTMVMNAVPAAQRGAASGVRMTFFNSGSALSIGVFFSLMVAGLSATLPHTLTSGLTGQGVPVTVARSLAGLPPVGILFAAFLGINPLATLLGPTGLLGTLPQANVATLTGGRFLPSLISEPFRTGLVLVFGIAAAMMAVAAVASWLAGRPAAAELSQDEQGERTGEKPVDWALVEGDAAGEPSDAAEWLASPATWHRRGQPS